MSICLIVPYTLTEINTFHKKRSDRREGELFGLIFLKREIFRGIYVNQNIG